MSTHKWKRLYTWRRSLNESSRHMRFWGSTLKLKGIYKREARGYISLRCEIYIMHKAGDAISSMVIRHWNRRWRREKSALTVHYSRSKQHNQYKLRQHKWSDKWECKLVRLLRLSYWLVWMWMVIVGVSWYLSANGVHDFSALPELLQFQSDASNHLEQSIALYNMTLHLALGALHVLPRWK